MCVRSPTCSWSLTVEDEVAVLPYLMRFGCGVPMLIGWRLVHSGTLFVLQPPPLLPPPPPLLLQAAVWLTG